MSIPDLGELRNLLTEVANPADVPAMEAYLKDQFTFLGVRSPDLRRATKPFLAAAGGLDGDGIVQLIHGCWREPEREFRYVGVNLGRKYVDRLGPDHLADIKHVIVTDSWWDTVDGLAAWVVGPMVRTHPELVAVMDEWIESDDLWLIRTAILHQLGYKDGTDADRLYRYALRRADHTDFFIRKAIGWALRQYARVDPDGVRAFVDGNEERFSGLTRREALKHLG